MKILMVIGTEEELEEKSQYVRSGLGE